MPTTTAVWPDRYYEEDKPEKRLRMLEEAMDAGEGDPAENEIRRRLWALRYEKPRKNAPTADRYMALWLTLDRWRGKGLLPWQNRTAARELRQLAARFRPDGPAEMVGPLLHRELVHAVRLYLKSCLQGSYSTVMLGTMRMTDGQIMEKAAREAAEVTLTVPRWAGLSEAFAPLAPAAREAFLEVFPDGGALLDREFLRCGWQGDRCVSGPKPL